MTRFLRTDIPETIVDVEQLIVWGMKILQYNYPETTYTEFVDDDGEPLPRRAVEANEFFYTAVKPGQWRHSARISLELAPEHNVSGKIWDHVQPLGQKAIPAGMKQGG